MRRRPRRRHGRRSSHPSEEEKYSSVSWRNELRRPAGLIKARRQILARRRGGRCGVARTFWICSVVMPAAGGAGGMGICCCIAAGCRNGWMGRILLPSPAVGCLWTLELVKEVLWYREPKELAAEGTRQFGSD